MADAETAASCPGDCDGFESECQPRVGGAGQGRCSVVPTAACCGDGVCEAEACPVDCPVPKKNPFNQNNISH